MMEFDCGSMICSSSMSMTMIWVIQMILRSLVLPIQNSLSLDSWPKLRLSTEKIAALLPFLWLGLRPRSLLR